MESMKWPPIDDGFRRTMWQATLNLDSQRPEVASMLSALERVDKVEPWVLRASLRALVLVPRVDPRLQRLMNLLHLYRASWRVTPLCGLTMWHEEATRYQTEYGGPSDYVSTKPLIVEFCTLAKYAEVLSNEVEKAASLAHATRAT